MPLQFEPQTTATAGSEPRYEAETLRKVAALAQRLQARHQETLSAAEIEQIGAEVGLDPAFVRAALVQVTASETAAAAASGSRTNTATGTGVASTSAVQTESVPGSDRRRLSRAIVAAWWAAGWTLPLILASVFDSGGSFFGGWGIYVGVGVFLSALTGHDKQERKKKLVQWGNPPVPESHHSRAAMLDTLFALLAQLEREKEHRAVLCMEVDDAAEVKRGASELAVEYSFGQLTALIREVVESHGGVVHSNSGDRVTATFRDDAGAVRAAREIQAALPRLNAERSRLSRPFSLRFGLSAGEVPADPAALLHSAVLDRAAALRDAAAPGGIVLSGELAAPGLLELGNLSPLPEPVLGAAAFKWCN